MMERINVDKNIDMPVEKVKVVWPYGEMEVGDSFLVGGDGKNLVVVVCARNKRVGEKLGRKFVAKRVEGGVRVWRKA